MKYLHIPFIAIAIVGCSPQQENITFTEEGSYTDTEVAVDEHGHEEGGEGHEIALAPVDIGPYKVAPSAVEQIGAGHYNIRLEGGDVNAVRIWVGTEDRSQFMVVKTDLEEDHYCGAAETPTLIPDEFALWIEVEDSEGNTHVGSTPLAEHTP